MPHSRRLFWYEDDVRAWQAAAVKVEPLVPRKRGRPTKVEQMIRERIEQAKRSDGL
jgi:hypothetical protein